MWIYIPDNDDEKEAWVGTLTPHDGPNSWWGFELIRHTDVKSLYRTSPFDKRSSVIGLLDHQRRCTLIRPLVHHIDPGSLGVRISFPRTRITGQFQALLSDLAVSDVEEEKFGGLVFQSEAFGAWYSPPKYRTEYDFQTATPAVEISETTRDDLILEIGRVTCTSGVEFSSQLRSGAIRSATSFRLEFSAPASLEKVMATCFGLERLFGFLIGFRGKPPIFKTWLNETYEVGDQKLSYDGTLDIAGINWAEGEPPHPMECIHLNGIGGVSLETILTTFLANQEDFVTRIHAVEFSRFFSKNINERFSVVMPILESHIKGKYTKPDEASYIQHREAFFDWIEKSESEDVKEFSRKHIAVKNEKAPSLATLLTRAIDDVNGRGFRFPAEMAGRLQKRRGRLFHAAPQMMRDQEVLEFFDEVRAATGLLMLHTFIDIGIDIALLADRHSALADLREFLVPPTRMGGSKDDSALDG
ncbi:hypothetical protein WI604_03170 [Bradyrhizobium symbiodeficiens]|uniref:ApeA N-terminal domain 1-containing protein n=1 Tax=Bradyrhizobium symbiodeficiens TaxID=1404367 RepID=UPI0030CF8E0C